MSNDVCGLALFVVEALARILKMKTMALHFQDNTDQQIVEVTEEPLLPHELGLTWHIWLFSFYETEQL